MVRGADAPLTVFLCKMEVTMKVTNEEKQRLEAALQIIADPMDSQQRTDAIQEIAGMVAKAYVERPGVEYNPARVPYMGDI